jgi:O-antigen/teichoic acid export membrane protein
MLDNPLAIESIKTLLLRIFGITVLFGFTIFLTRNYPPELIGKYDFIRTFLLVVGSISILGMDQSILYFSSVLKYDNNYGALKKIYNKMIVIILSISILLLVIFLLIGEEQVTYFLNDLTIYPFIFKALAILFFYSVTIFNTEVFRAFDKIYIAELFRNTFKYISLIVGAIILLYLQQENYLVDAFLIGFIFLAFVSTFMVYRFLGKNGLVSKQDLYPYVHIIKKSYPIAISTMAIFLLTTIDILFIKKYHGDKMVAQYGVGVKFMTIVAMIIQLININISTKIATFFYNKNQNDLKNLLKNSSRIIFALVLPVVIVVLFFSQEILSIFGKDYLVVDNAMKIMVIGQGLIALFGAAPIYLNMTGRQNVFQIILLLAVILNIILNINLIPKFGMEGAAIAYVISMLFWNTVTIYLAYKKDKINLFLH